MLSLPNYSAQITLNDFLPLWRIIEDYIDKQKILSAGVCDFMLPLFSELCDSCKVNYSKKKTNKNFNFNFFPFSINHMQIKLI
jgi:diketogulonate reductase-like aldo/keto reductase